MQKIDFHTHILPKMDDGAKDTKESLELLRMEQEQGVTDVYLTPHFYPDQDDPDSFLARRASCYKRLLEVMKEDGGKFPSLHLGAEVAYYPGISNMERLNEFHMGDSNMILLEMPFRVWGEREIDEVLGLKDNGHDIVLAHIERYFDFVDEETLKMIFSEDVKFQVNVSTIKEYGIASFTEKDARDKFFDNRDKRYARRLYRMNLEQMLSYVGTDCHNADKRKAEW